MAAGSNRPRSRVKVNAPLLEKQIMCEMPRPHSPGRITFPRVPRLLVALGFQRGATTMMTQNAKGWTDKRPTAVDECVPGLLTEAELETVAAGGGAPGINPSRMGGGAGVNPSRS